MSKIVVLGAGGMLGHKVCQQLAGHQRIGLVRRDPSAYGAFEEAFRDTHLIGGVDVLADGVLESKLRELEPDFVVNCVGLVKQLEAAADAYLAVAINSYLPHRLALLCRESNARLIHVSTDCVFDGRAGAYREDQLTDARDLYGRSKALGETTADEAAAVTLRTSFIGRELGRSTHGLVEWFLAQEGGAVDGYAGVMYSGLTSLELSRAIAHVIDGPEEVRGLFHVAGEPISKYHLLELVRRTYGLDIEVRRADEPILDRTLVMDRFSRATGYSAPSWAEMIRQMFEDPTPYDKWRMEIEN